MLTWRLIGAASAIATALCVPCAAETTSPSAQPIQPAAVIAPNQPIDLKEGCMALAPGATAIRNKLQALDIVYGKPAIDWTTPDFEALLNVARACDRQPMPDKSFVSQSTWYGAINGARQKIYVLTETNRQVEAFGLTLGFDKAKRPSCTAIARYSSDTWSWTDNSSELFGLDLMALSSNDILTMIQWVNQCSLVTPGYASAAMSLGKAESDALMSRLMDKMLLIVKRRRDYDREGNHRETDILVSKDGVVIPPTFTGKATREMVDIYNRSAATNRRFTPERVSQLLAFSDRIAKERRSAFDVLYAEAIRAKVQEQIFTPKDQLQLQQSQQMPAVPAAPLPAGAEQ